MIPFVGSAWSKCEYVVVDTPIVSSRSIAIAGRYLDASPCFGIIITITTIIIIMNNNHYYYETPLEVGRTAVNNYDSSYDKLSSNIL